MTGDIELRRKGPLLWVTPALHDCGNALSWKMIDALAALFTQLAEDRATRLVVLRGAGKNFCAGLDCIFVHSPKLTQENPVNCPRHLSTVNMSRGLRSLSRGVR